MVEEGMEMDFGIYACLVAGEAFIYTDMISTVCMAR